MSQITTHVLDTSLGRPAAGVPVTLEIQKSGGWQEISKGATDADGRLRHCGGDLPPDLRDERLFSCAESSRPLSADHNRISSGGCQGALPHSVAAEPLRIFHVSRELTHGHQAGEK
jgi:hypothetical protein